ncbi:MAG: hypothetical protein RSB72_02680 [Bacilli bacterium]
MTENLVKRYLLEMGYQDGTYEKQYQNKTIVKDRLMNDRIFQEIMYSKYLRGDISISPVTFRIWLSNLVKNKHIFGHYLKTNGYITKDSEIMEITEDPEISSINGILKITKEIIISNCGDGCMLTNKEKNVKHLVINGRYVNQLGHIKAVLQNGSFSIGYCGNDNNYTKSVLEYYRKLKEYLLINGAEVEAMEDTIFTSKKMLVLNYNCKPIIEDTVSFTTQISNR